MKNNYLFTSERLGFRNWQKTDLDAMSVISADPEVMNYFPSTQDKKHTQEFINRMQSQFDKNGFCYFAVELLKTKEFIGFIGICEQHYKTDFNPAVDIGWRLHKKFWFNGYATEGARACLTFAFKTIGLKKIVSVASKGNLASIAVMKKVGMTKVKEFEHPLLLEHKDLKYCVLYEIKT
ncbi:MAG: GNAT family N-acetyltransferase [Flavobacteriaceae bacterium]